LVAKAKKERFHKNQWSVNSEQWSVFRAAGTVEFSDEKIGPSSPDCECI